MQYLIALLFIGLAAAHRPSCQCERGCGPGYEKSFLDYRGKFVGGARKYMPAYQRITSEEQQCIVKGGCGAHPHREHHHCDDHREKRHCKCEAGCGPGYEKSFLDYRGKFVGGARKYMPAYQRITSEEQQCIVKGGCGAHGHPH